MEAENTLIELNNILFELAKKAVAGTISEIDEREILAAQNLLTELKQKIKSLSGSKGV